MKKIISIALALVMMMAICVPAFAETAVLGKNTVNVETTYDATTDASYTVQIPATISVFTFVLFSFSLKNCSNIRSSISMITIIDTRK